ncbi:MAG: bifunctional chorismate mutase/prephenate dehydrogenase [Deltaproteobacteria bacterium]|nr:bifunctional chorismate mutase/prephenate dehydrogenase [Deltaproteobacteria bacterium]
MTVGDETKEPLTRARPIAVLRAMIDAIDRDVLELLARRMEVVSEVARFKRAHGVRIRDFAREREILEDRSSRARALGLPGEAIESIFRLVLWASRDRQAQLRAEVPPDVEPKTVAIIGGAGAMGSLLARMFGDLGHHVMVADVGTALRPVEAAAAADVVVVSVPIAVTEAVIREIGPEVREDALLMDVTSIKERPLRAMLESTRASVLGTHPMFGPAVHSLQGQRIVLCRGRGDAWGDWVRTMLRARGLVVSEAAADEHDRAMAVVQVLTHLQTQVTGLALARLGVPLAETLRYTSPAYLLELYAVGRHFAQSPALYGPIEMENPRSAEVAATFRRAADELAQVVGTKDQRRFGAAFDEVRQFLGPFTEEALEQSAFLIDRLVERS